jgi:hypothetical protein
MLSKTRLSKVGDAPHLDAMLEFFDGSAFQGISFGAEGKSVAGECVFQTGDALLKAHLHLPFLILLLFQAWLDT